MATNNDGKGTYVQIVKIEVEVQVNHGDDDLNRVSVTDLNEAIESHVDRLIGKSELSGSLVSLGAKRGPGGSRYFFPGEAVRTDSALPVTVDLAELNVPTYVADEAVTR